jgi:MFS family permease
VGAFYFWIIGIGAEPVRFAWDTGLVEYYKLPGPTVVRGTYAVRGYYDLLARAFAHGKLYLPIEPQPELLALPNPWEDPANERFRVLDTVLYQRHYYLYHGAAPVLLLFTPWYLLTRHDLPENFAAFLLALGGYFFLSLLFLQLLFFLSRPISAALSLLCLLALGIGSSVPFLLHRALLYEVAIACGFCCVSAGFYFLFRRLTDIRRRVLWSALSGLSFGLAIGCRPHLGLAAACAFVFLLLWSDPAERFRRKDVLAFALPVIACGLAITAYNYARFGNPLEFGLRYQLGENSYQNVHLSLVNVVPGLYYLLLCPPDLVPEFPFVRLAYREPFDALIHLPARYFLEPIGGVLSLCPVALLAVLTPLVRRRFGGRRGIFAFVLTMLVFTIACILFLAATGLTSQRYEVDFQPFLVLVACVIGYEFLGNLPQLPRAFCTVSLAVLLLYTIGANAALALQGPYDQFVQASPHTYVQIAKWFSPMEAYRPLENPSLRVQAEFDLPWPCTLGREPLLSAGEFGSRYLLSSQCVSDGRIRLFSETSFRSPDWRTVEVDYVPGLNRAALEYNPQNRIMTVSWNGQVVLQHRLRFLVTAPSQIYLGWDPTLGNKLTFPRRMAMLQQEVLPAPNWATLP